MEHPSESLQSNQTEKLVKIPKGKRSKKIDSAHGSLNVEVGTNPSDFNKRVEKVNENNKSIDTNLESGAPQVAEVQEKSNDIQEISAPKPSEIVAEKKENQKEKKKGRSKAHVDQK